MGKRLFEVLEGAAATGFFAGLYVLTGMSLDPQEISGAVIDAMTGYFRNNTDVVLLLENVKLALLVQGLIASLVLLGAILYCGKRGIITAICGYFGTLLLIAGLARGLDALLFPAVLLAGGVLCAKYLPDRGDFKLIK